MATSIPEDMLICKKCKREQAISLHLPLKYIRMSDWGVSGHKVDTKNPQYIHIHLQVFYCIN